MQRNTGWIALYRSLRSHWLWAGPFSEGQAWVDLLLRANHATKRIPTKVGSVAIGRGQLLVSTRNLAADWDWSRGRVRRFFDRLIADGMISTVEAIYGTVVTIANFSDAQDFEPTNGTTNRTTGRTTNETTESIENTELFDIVEPTDDTTNEPTDDTTNGTETTNETKKHVRFFRFLGSVSAKRRQTGGGALLEGKDERRSEARSVDRGCKKLCCISHRSRD